jgi:hypothetical protein
LPLLAACKVLPPPPVMAPHAPTAPDDRGTTTAMLIVGTAGEVLGGDGWGVALRVEHQETERTTVGVELTGGRGTTGAYADDTLFRHYLIAARGYGRFADIDEVALTYGAGLSWMRTGMITGSLQASFAASYPNDYLVPLGQLGIALAVPLRKGRAFKEESRALNFGDPEPQPPPRPWPGLVPLQTPPPPKARQPSWEIYITADLGLIVPIGNTGNRLSLDLGFAGAQRAHEGLYSLSVADSQH